MILHTDNASRLQVDQLLTDRDPASVSDRFFVKRLMRALTFPHVAPVLSLALGSVRLIEPAADVDPSQVRLLEDIPPDLAAWPAAPRSRIALRAGGSRAAKGRTC